MYTVYAYKCMVLANPNYLHSQIQAEAEAAHRAAGNPCKLQTCLCTAFRCTVLRHCVTPLCHATVSRHCVTPLCYATVSRHCFQVHCVTLDSNFKVPFLR